MSKLEKWLGSNGFALHSSYGFDPLGEQRRILRRLADSSLRSEMRYIEQFTACRVLPDFEKGVADDDSPRRQLAQQLCHGLGSLTVSRDNYGPFQVLPKFAGDDAPLIERARRSRSDLNERPVSNQRKRDFAVRQWAVNNEMVVAMYQNPYHVKAGFVQETRQGATEPGE